MNAAFHSDIVLHLVVGKTEHRLAPWTVQPHLVSRFRPIRNRRRLPVQSSSVLRFHAVLFGLPALGYIHRNADDTGHDTLELRSLALVISSLMQFSISHVARFQWKHMAHPGPDWRGRRLCNSPRFLRPASQADCVVIKNRSSGMPTAIAEAPVTKTERPSVCRPARCDRRVIENGNAISIRFRACIRIPPMLLDRRARTIPTTSYHHVQPEIGQSCNSCPRQRNHPIERTQTPCIPTATEFSMTPVTAKTQRCPDDNRNIR